MKTRKSLKRLRPNQVYSALVVAENNKFKLLDAFELRCVNQYKKEWQKMPSRELARMMNGKLVVN